MHRAGLVPAVGNGVEQVAHTRILCALLSCAEVVVHHLVYDIVGYATTAVRNPKKKEGNRVQQLCYCKSRNSQMSAGEQAFSHSPDYKVNVIIGNSDNHIGHVVWGVQMAFHCSPEETHNTILHLTLKGFFHTQGC